MLLAPMLIILSCLHLKIKYSSYPFILLRLINLRLISFFFVVTLLLISCSNSSPHKKVPDLLVTNVAFNQIVRYDLTTKDKTILIDNGLGFPWRITVDKTTNRIYWTNVDKNLVQSAKPDGTDIRDLSVVTYPQGITLDEERQKVYVAESGSPYIIEMNTDGSQLDTLKIDGLLDPDNLIYNPNNAHLYWIDLGHKSIYRSTLTDQSSEALFTLEQYDPLSMAIDDHNAVIYWFDKKSCAILKSSLDGSDPREVIKIDGLITGMAIDLANQILYYVDVASKTLGSYNPKTGQLTELIKDETLGFHASIALLKTT